MPVTRLGPRCYRCQRRPVWDEPTQLCSPCARLARVFPGVLDAMMAAVSQDRTRDR